MLRKKLCCAQRSLRYKDNNAHMDVSLESYRATYQERQGHKARACPSLMAAQLVAHAECLTHSVVKDTQNRGTVE